MNQRMLVIGSVLTLCCGCGVSNTINSELRQQEQTFEVQAISQALQNSNLMVSNLFTTGLQSTTSHCQATGGGSCQACFTDDSAQRTRSLSLTACALPTPSQGANYDLRLTVASLSLLAT